VSIFIKPLQFKINKRSGGQRTINAPEPKLKLLQSRLSDLLQNCIDEINDTRNINSAISHGFRPKYSIITNAKTHRNRRYVFNIDLENFFGTINFGRVRGFFISNRNYQLNQTVATILAQIACHENSLPQGSPCSPVISNLIGHILDIRLAKLAYETGCTYSRYADDLTFSTNKPIFPNQIAVLIGADNPSEDEKHTWQAGEKLEKIIRKAGFEINQAKTRMQYDGSRQEVTGLIVNKKINTRCEYRRTARAMVHRLLKTGTFQSIQETYFDDKGNLVVTEVDGTLEQLNGILGFIDSVGLYNRKKALNSNEMKNIHKPLSNLDSNEKTYQSFLLFKYFYAASKPVIVCEGKTDNIYIRSAIQQLASHYPYLVSNGKPGKFNLNVKLFQYTNTTKRLLKLGGGTDNLRQFLTDFPEFCQKISASGLQHPIIILVDNDSGAKTIFSAVKHITKTKTPVDGTKPFYFVSPNLYIVPTPKNDSGGDTMIEDFFDVRVRNIKIDGKSFSSNDKLNKRVEYGKYIFAKQVIQKNQQDINFKGFIPILDRIMAVLDDYKKTDAITSHP
jgi:Reverse transcriptase (RNA-dependent DNA polymerase).